MTEPPQFDPPPPVRTPTTTAAPQRRAETDRLPMLVGGFAVVVGTAAVVAVFVLAGGSSSASTPTGAVRQLLVAGQTADLKKANSALCAGDRALGGLSHLQSSGRVTTYQVGAASVQDGITVVQATYSTTTSSAAITQSFPVVKENGSWRVCFSKPLTSLPGGAPTNSPSSASSFTFPIGGTAPIGGTPSGSSSSPLVLPTLPSLTGAASLCSGSTSGFGAASTYLGAVALRVTQIAQACVYRDSVPESVTASLSGILFHPITTDQNASVIDFVSSDGATHVTVTTAREPDGIYYVTAVQVH